MRRRQVVGAIGKSRGRMRLRCRPRRRIGWWQPWRGCQELRDTVALVLGEEMTQAEAGLVLGVSEGTVAWRMSEVKKRLRAMAAEDAR